MRALTRYTQYALAALLLPTLASCGSGGGGDGGTTAVTPMTFTAVDHTTGDGPTKIAIADLNSDGALDVVTANYRGESISILLGNGDGTLQPRQDIPIAPRIYSIAIGDLNGDTVPDLAVVFGEDLTTDTVAVLYGQGNGVFAAPMMMESNQLAGDVAIADFNEDTFPDIAVVHGLNDPMIFVNNGNETFAPPVSMELGSWTRALAVADFDGDSHLDIVTAHIFIESRISILMGNGDATFQPGITHLVKENASSFDVQIGDVDRDANLDIVIPVNDGRSLHDDGEVAVFLGNGDGTFAPHVKFPTGANPISVGIGDMNGDTLPDIVTGGERISILAGHGTGFFDAEQTVDTQFQPGWLGLADMNGDGLLDIVTANFHDDRVTVLLQQ